MRSPHSSGDREYEQLVAISGASQSLERRRHAAAQAAGAPKRVRTLEERLLETKGNSRGRLRTRSSPNLAGGARAIAALREEVRAHAAAGPTARSWAQRRRHRRCLLRWRKMRVAPPEIDADALSAARSASRTLSVGLPGGSELSGRSHSKES